MLTSARFGFRAKRSTELACQSAIRDMYSYLEQGNYVLGVFIDFAKAFDSLKRTKLLKKLYRFDIRSNELLWFKSYFASRKQYVVYNIFSSILLPADNGVPQGKIVGPILFFVFINDFDRKSCSSKFILLADDVSVFIFDKSLTRLISRTYVM